MIKSTVYSFVIMHPGLMSIDEVNHNKSFCFRGAWVAQSVECLTLAQVMISWFIGSSPTSGSVLTAQSPEPALDSVSPSLSAPLQHMLCLSLSLYLSKINKCKKIFFS